MKDEPISARILLFIIRNEFHNIVYAAFENFADLGENFGINVLVLAELCEGTGGDAGFDAQVGFLHILFD